MKQALLAIIFVGVFSLGVRSQQPAQSEREAMYYRYLEFPSYVKGGSIEPHWMADGSSFWYAEGAPANTVIWKVDPVANTKTQLFDTARLRQAVTPLLGHGPPHEGLPFEDFTFVDGEKAVRFTVENKEFILQLDTYSITRAPTLSDEEKSRLVPQAGEVLSPDRCWFAGVQDHNLWLRSRTEGRSVQLTTDGLKGYQWVVEGLQWSPDSTKLLARKVDARNVPQFPIVGWLKPTEEVEWIPYARVGGSIEQQEIFIIDVRSKRQTRIDTGEEPAVYFVLSPGWRSDSSEVLFQKVYRRHKKLELMAADPQNGKTRIVLTETQKTFVVGALEQYGHRLFIPVQDGKRFIWISERDGWRHLYLYDREGNLLRRLTEGAFPVVQILAVEEKAGRVYFTAHAEKRLYDTHLYSVTLEGKNFTRLTEGPGQHEIRFTPSKEFFLDTHSSVDRPPAVELRRADGTVLQLLARANIDALKELQWTGPEEFVVKAADGTTDLYGVLYKPYDFDRNKKYSVIEVIYAGPQTAQAVRRIFIPQLHDRFAHELAQLGFVTFVVDGRGTPQRGKAFQDVSYGNIGRNEIPDHLAVLRQLAEDRSYIDLSRVGIFGHSFGGYMAIRAVLLAPDVYQVAVASAPVGELDNHWRGIEGYMDLPQNNKEGYEYASNLRLVRNLRGKLLLIHGTSDASALFSDTMRMVDALMQANKPYALAVLPEVGHSSAAMPRYWREAIRRYLQEHLKP